MTRPGGLDPGRVAQLRVVSGSGERRGSGYRTTGTTVLTAAHVVEGARAVHVVFNADLPEQWSRPATVAVRDPAADVAVLTFDPPGPHRSVTATRFGQVGRQPAVLACRAVGFPRFKLRTDPATPGTVATPYRDAHQADGTISSLSNWREGTLEITVPGPAPDPDRQHSPWEGMSGAAVWCGDRVVGVVSRHHPSDGLNRLAAVRVSRWYRQLPAARLAELQGLVGLPPTAEQLDDVIGPDPSRLAAASYVAQIEDIAPLVLRDREEELAELTAFCAGDEPYAWWQGGPWAGKTALASWFALNPPVGVTVVSFFVTRRLAGQADSGAYTDAVVEQLAAIAGEPDLHPGSAAARDGQRRRLLKDVAARAAAEGRRVLLLVDGLDEDEGVPPAGPSSIAALLPRRPLDGLRVLVTSRPHRGLPDDVPPDHPLRRLRDDHPSPTRRPRHLEPSSLAEELQVLAKTELVEHLHGDDQLARDVIGCVAAAGGGLTLAELSELTGAGHVALEALFRGRFGRSTCSRPRSHLPGERGEPVHLFAHETLRVMAEEQMGRDVDRYRQRLNQWADSYRERGWPDGTPRYLGRPYSSMLSATADLARLVRLVAQPRRHDWMLAATATDAGGVAEILAVQQFLLDTPDPRLTDLGLIAVERFRLSLRNSALPPELPSVWVLLGQAERAQAMARSITDPARRAPVMAQVAAALVTAGEADRAEQMAGAVFDPVERAQALTQVACALAAAGEADRAERLARALADPEQRVQVLAHVATAWALAGQADRAEHLARAVTDSDRRTEVLAQVAAALVAAGDPDRAEQLARRIPGRDHRVQVLTHVAAGLAAAGLTNRAEQLVRGLPDTGRQADVLAQVAAALVAAGHPEPAERLAGTVSDPHRKAQVLSRVAAALVAAGRTGRAEELAATLADPYGQAWALAQIAGALAAAGDSDAVERVARAAERRSTRIPDPYHRDQVLAHVAVALASVGHVESAERLAHRTGSRWRTWTVLGIARALVAAGRVDRAQQTLRAIPDPAERARALARTAGELAPRHPVGAERLALAAEQLSRRTGDPGRLVPVLSEVGAALVAAGEVDEAERLAAALTDPDDREEVLARIGTALVATGRTEHAERLAHAFADPHRRAGALAEVAAALVSAGRADRAELLARSLPQPDSGVLTPVIAVLAAVGEADRAERMCRLLTDPFRQAQALAVAAGGLASAGQASRATRLATAAERLAHTLADPARQTEVIAQVAAALASVRRFDWAQQLTDDRTDPDERRRVLVSLVPSLVAAGQADLAEELVRTLPDPYLQAQVLAELGLAFVSSGQLDRAEVLARNLRYPDQRAQVLARLAPALAGAGRADRAEQLAGAIPEPDLQADVLARVAGALVGQRSASARARARALVSRVLTTGSWHHAASVLSTLDPAALSSIATALRGDPSGSPVPEVQALDPGDRR